MNVADWVIEAYPRIVDHIRRTPLQYSPYLSNLTNAEVYLKLENWQITGSFKARGGLNKILSLSKEQLLKGVVAASTGNHAAAVANAVRLVGSKAIIFMPETVSKVKVDNLAQYEEVEIKLVGQDSVEAEIAALEYAQNSQQVYVSPYNDQEIIGGQGTIALEILEDEPGITDIFVPVGGGGLIAGIAGYAKQFNSGIKIHGCQPTNSAVMHHSIKAGKVLMMESQPTVSDGTAGGLEQDSITFPICQQYVDDFYLVSEEEILASLLLLIEKHYLLAEGSAALSVASLLKNKEIYQGKKVALILCGNKISLSLLEKVLKQTSI